MAMQTTDTPINSTVSLSRPIPGQGLTNDPDSPYPWEKAPEFVNLDESLRYLLDIITQREAYSSLMDMTGQGTPLMEISQVLLFQGFTEGKWNPDLMMILAEPLCYMLLALCERNDIDPVIYDGEDEDSDEEVQMFNVDMKKDKLRKLADAARKDSIPAGVLPTDIKEDLENIEVASLLAQPDQAVEDDINSLLGRN
tara:strand:+ start:19 stop:609 length:591 start_codon:yes stop_codon:yes gene_type:complete